MNIIRMTINGVITLVFFLGVVVAGCSDEGGEDSNTGADSDGGVKNSTDEEGDSNDDTSKEEGDTNDDATSDDGKETEKDDQTGDESDEDTDPDTDENENEGSESDDDEDTEEGLSDDDTEENSDDDSEEGSDDDTDDDTEENTDEESGDDTEKGSDDDTEEDTVEDTSEDTSEDTEEPSDTGESIPPEEVENRVEELLSGLSTEQKVAQMTQAQYEDVSTNSAFDNCFGSIFNGGEELPFANNPENWASNLDALQGATIDGCGIPMLYGIDAVHGNAKVIGSTVFPHGIGLGATRDPEIVEKVGRVTGKECRGAGIHLTFAPSVSVARDERWGRTYEGFAETPEVNAEIGAAYIKGLQGGGDLADPGSIAATAKHYVGDGGTTDGANNGVNNFGEATMRAIHLPPYEAAVAQKVAAIMPSYHRWSRDGQEYYMSADTFSLSTLLKEELGFEGFCLSDYDAVARTTGGLTSTYTNDNVSASVNAGMDMAMIAMEGGIDAWMNALQSGQISEDRIDDAVRRILRIKVRMDLFDNGFAKAYSNEELRGQIWSTEHQEIAREAVQKSLVLLKNDGSLPLDKGETIKMAGAYADSMGAQAGGWTVGWQGTDAYTTNEVMGETLLSGLQAVGQSVESSSDFQSGDKVVVVVGEFPYAEGNGDHGSGGGFMGGSPASVYLEDQTGYGELESALGAGAQVVLVILSGRPMVMESSIVDGCDAIVAAWLPGSRGIGVADVLFGDVDFSGKLPHTWPADFGSIPVNVNTQGDEPGSDPSGSNTLYEYGHGLSYN